MRSTEAESPGKRAINAAFLYSIPEPAMAAIAILTLYEGDYHYGVASLVNSSIASGFKGRFLIGFRDKLPPWTSSLTQASDNEFVAESCRLTFFREQPTRHLGYQKPFAILSSFQRHADIDVIYYADPDITFQAPWAFFDSWWESGICLVQDCNFPHVHENHPWRTEWVRVRSRRRRNIRS